MASGEASSPACEPEKPADPFRLGVPGEKNVASARGSIAGRFLAKVVPSGSCWLWTASANFRGYGWFRVDGKTVKSHRMSWAIHHGPIPRGLYVLHSCDTPACVNPAHLRLGTHQDNMRDKVQRPREAATHCQRGHEFTPENSLVNHRGGRSCRECHNASARRRRHARLLQKEETP